MALARQSFLFWLLFMATSLTAFSQTIESGKAEIQLIELYTSEGCSSCPPADQWLTQLLAHPRLWKDFVPIAFHVDYWDGLGWRDGFSKPEFGERQRIYKQQGNIATIYTPGFVIQGKEWRSWLQNFTRPTNTLREVGNLSITLMENRAHVHFKSEKEISNGTLHFAWLGFGFERRIPRGENAGKTLQEDFVVLSYEYQLAEAEENQLFAEFDLDNPDVVGAQKLAVVAWVSPQDNQRPIQAVGGWYRINGGSQSD